MADSRLSLSDLLLHLHITDAPQRTSYYVPLLAPQYQNLNFDQLNKAKREAYALLASVGQMRRFRDKNIKGYQFEITDKG